MSESRDLDRLLRGHYRAVADDSVPDAQVRDIVARLPAVSQRPTRTARRAWRWSVGRSRGLILGGLLVLTALGAALVVGGPGLLYPSPRNYQGVFRGVQVFPGSPDGHAGVTDAARSLDGRALLLVRHGRSAPSAPDEIMIQDPDTGAFTSGGSLTVVDSRARLAALPDDRVLAVIGGEDPHLEVLDLGTRTLTASIPTQDDHLAGAVTRLADGRELITGGLQVMDGKDVGRIAELYDPVSGEVRTVGPMVEGRINHQAVLLRDGRVLVVGGDEGTPTAEAFDPVTETFQDLGVIERELADGYAMSLAPLADGRVLLVGGWGIWDPGTPMPPGPPVAHLFDPATNTFRATGALPEVRQGFVAAPLVDGRVLVAGGYGDNETEDADDAFVFDPASERFEMTGAMSVGRVMPVATTLGDGRVIVGGSSCDAVMCPGATSTSPALSVEVYE